MDQIEVGDIVGFEYGGGVYKAKVSRIIKDRAEFHPNELGAKSRHVSECTLVSKAPKVKVIFKLPKHKDI